MQLQVFPGLMFSKPGETDGNSASYRLPFLKFAIGADKQHLISSFGLERSYVRSICEYGTFSMFIADSKNRQSPRPLIDPDCFSARIRLPIFCYAIHPYTLQCIIPERSRCDLFLIIRFSTNFTNLSTESRFNAASMNPHAPWTRLSASVRITG
jgi:hypothetical protein